MSSLPSVVRVRVLTSSVACTAAMLGPPPYRIFHMAAPQEIPRPYIVFGRVSGGSPHHMLGTGALDIATVQVEGFCDRAADMETLAEIVRNTCDGYRGTVAVDAGSYDVRHIRVMDRSTDVFYPDTARALPIYHFNFTLELAAFQTIPTL